MLLFRNNPRKKPLRTYGRPPKTATANAVSDSDDEWPTVDDNVPRPNRAQPKRK